MDGHFTFIRDGIQMMQLLDCQQSYFMGPTAAQHQHFSKSMTKHKYLITKMLIYKLKSQYKFHIRHQCQYVTVLVNKSQQYQLHKH